MSSIKLSEINDKYKNYNIQIFETPRKVSTGTTYTLQYNGKVGKKIRANLLM